MRQLGWKRADHFGISLHNAIVMPYIWHYGTEEQKQRWLPKLSSGEMLLGIAITEPGCGTDLKAIATRARRDGDHYVIDGAKTFITNGYTCNLLIVVARTGEAGSRGLSLIVVETENLPGFRVGRLLDKIGMKAQDTSELFFDDVRVAADAVLGGVEGQGFFQLMGDLPYERTIMGVRALATAIAVEYAEELATALKPWETQLDETVVRAVTAHDRLDEVLALVEAAAPAQLGSGGQAGS